MRFLSVVCGCKTANVLPNTVGVVAGVNRVHIPVEVGGTTIHMVWDTGAAISVLSSDIADRIGVSYDTSKVVGGFVFLSNINSLYNSSSRKGDAKFYQAEKVTCKIGSETYSFQPVVSTSHKNLSVFGNDFMSNYYYAVHITNNRLSLSTEPLSFSKYEITDSLVFSGNYGNDPIYKVKIESDSLNLLFDSGMAFGMSYNNGDIFLDIVLSSKDSTDIVYKVIDDLKKKCSADISYYLGGLELKTIYDSTFCIDGYTTISNIPYLIDSTIRDDINGFITYCYIARFDIVYYDLKSKVMKLYKVKNHKSLMRDVSIWERLSGEK